MEIFQLIEVCRLSREGDRGVSTQWTSLTREGDRGVSSCKLLSPPVNYASAPILQTPGAKCKENFAQMQYSARDIQMYRNALQTYKSKYKSKANEVQFEINS